MIKGQMEKSKKAFADSDSDEEKGLFKRKKKNSEKQTDKQKDIEEDEKPIIKKAYVPKKVKNTTKLQQIKKLSEMHESWQDYSKEIQDNIAILKDSNTKLNKSVNVYDMHLNQKLFLEMVDHPEKADQYKSNNESKVLEIDGIISSISVQIQEVQQDASKFNSMSLDDDDEAPKEEEYNKLASSINTLLTELHNSEDKFKKLKREFDKKLKEISNNVEDEQNRLKKEFRVAKNDPYAKKIVSHGGVGDDLFSFNADGSSNQKGQMQAMANKSKEELRIQAELNDVHYMLDYKLDNLTQIKSTTEDVVQLAENFGDQLTMQGVKIDKCEELLEDAHEQQLKAKKELQSIAKKQGKNNKRLGCMACCLCVVTIFLLMLFFGVPIGGSAKKYVAPGAATTAASSSSKASTTTTTTSATDAIETLKVYRLYSKVRKIFSVPSDL